MKTQKTVVEEGRETKSQKEVNRDCEDEKKTSEKKIGQ